MNMRDLKNLSSEDVLGMMGLARRQTFGELTLEIAGLVGIGVLIGASIALLVAPRSGRELREEIKKKVLPNTEAAADDTLDSLPRSAPYNRG